MELCRVPGCDARGRFEVILYDFYPDEVGRGLGNVFWEQDFTCPFICYEHAQENEETAVGSRDPLDGLKPGVSYKYTNQGLATGFSIYRPLP